ncbi:MAG: hypothetical protein JNM76_03530 [Betaproteobacteria bacterium]|nr:hypothetical protein [Betaproteobacteria bacterium]
MRLQTIHHLLLAVAIVALLAACGKKSGPSKDFLDKYETVFRTAFNEDQMTEALCVYAGPFPLDRRDSDDCRLCEALRAAGLLSEDIITESDRTLSRYALTPQGKDVYRDDVNRDAYELAKKRWDHFKSSENPPDALDYARPRLCFGKERYHSIVETLPPVQLGSGRAISTKLVSEVQDVNSKIWDPQMAPLGLRVPPRPEPGKPVLYPPRVVTFVYEPTFNFAWIDESLRYGAWINEK